MRFIGGLAILGSVLALNACVREPDLPPFNSAACDRVDQGILDARVPLADEATASRCQDDTRAYDAKVAELEAPWRLMGGPQPSIESTVEVTNPNGTTAASGTFYSDGTADIHTYGSDTSSSSRRK